MPLARRVRNAASITKFADVVESVSLKSIVRKFDDSAVITPELLEERKLISSAKSIVKLIGAEELTAAYKFKVHRVSKALKR